MTELTPVEKKLKDLPINSKVEVEWVDAKSTDAWMEQSELVEKTNLCKISSVGFLVRDKVFTQHPFHLIVLALSQIKTETDEKVEQISQTISIPVSCITKVTQLRYKD